VANRLHKHRSGVDQMLIDRVLEATPNRWRPKVYVGAWEKVRAEGKCRFCGRPWSVRRATRHHVVPQSWFKKEGVAFRASMNDGRNVIGLCRPCHDRVDLPGDAEERLKARRELRVTMTQAEVAFAIAARGKRWLDRNYPPPPVPSDGDGGAS